MKVELTKLSRKARAGFSLVELLVVIAVIGIMAAIAIPIISNINENARLAKDRRNAQNIANVYGAAIAAGAPVDSSTVGAIIDDLQAGVNGTGQFATTVFKVNISDDEAGEADDYLSMTVAGVLDYNG